MLCGIEIARTGKQSEIKNICQHHNGHQHAQHYLRVSATNGDFFQHDLIGHRASIAAIETAMNCNRTKIFTDEKGNLHTRWGEQMIA